MRAAATIAIAISVISCSPQRAQVPPSPQPSPTIVALGCGNYSLLVGAGPKWLDEAGAHNNPASVPYVLASPPIAAGFLFGYPLTVDRTGENKVLWVMGKPRNGAALVVTGHPTGSNNPLDGWRFDANSGPGEIYPSILNVPQPGCWQFDLSWAGNHATIDLNYD